MLRLAAAPTLPLPSDVRLMNAVASFVYASAALVMLAAGLLWLVRAPWLPIRSIQLEGELLRSNLSTVRANAAPKLAGNFFSFDLQRGRAAFESVPWVRRAVVRRIWPDRLAVRLLEHRAAALWQDEDGDERLLNTEGEVFEANIGDVEDEGLPTLAGPEGSAPQVLRLYRLLLPLFAQAGLGLDTVTLNGRGSWRAGLGSGAEVELGRGTEAELLARSERFVRTLGQVTGRYQRPLEYADLRHADGYAVRLKGVTTAPGAKKN